MTTRVHPAGWDLIKLSLHGEVVEQHVIPNDDLREHHENVECWCAPVEDDEEPNLWAHNSLDRREHYEVAGRVE